MENNNNTLRGKKCVGLTRCSGISQAGDGLSNDQQLALLKNHANRHGMIWMGEERAEGISASNTDKREDIENLLLRAKMAKDFDVLLIQSFDRLTRAGAEHGAFLLHSFALLNVKVISIMNDIPQNEYTPLLQTVEFIKGHAQAVSISQATVRGRSASLFDGRLTYCLRPPYGIDRLILSNSGAKLFRIRNLSDRTQQMLRCENDEVIDTFGKNPSRKDQEKHGIRHFKKHVDQKVQLILGAPERVEAVKLMFQLYFTQDMGVHRIARELSRRGIEASDGGTWSPGSIDQIIHNPIYLGRGIANGVCSGIYYIRPTQEGIGPLRTNNPTKKETYRPESDWIIIKYEGLDFVPAELQETIWQWQLAALRKRRDPNRKPFRRCAASNSPHLLLGTVFDKHTGRPMCARRGGKDGKYRRYNVRRHPTVETQTMRNSFVAEPLEKAVLESLVEVLGNAEEYRPFLKRYAGERFSRVRRDIVDLNKLIKEREKKREQKAFTLKEYGDIGEDRLRAIIAPLTNAILNLDERILAAENLAGMAHNDADGILDSVMRDMKDIAKSVGQASSASFRSILQVFTKTVVDVLAQDAEIEVRLPSDVMRRKHVLKEVCNLSSFSTKSAQDAHLEKPLILAAFRCKPVSKGVGGIHLIRTSLSIDGKSEHQTKGKKAA